MQIRMNVPPIFFGPFLCRHSVKVGAPLKMLIESGIIWERLAVFQKILCNKKSRDLKCSVVIDCLAWDKK